MPEQVATSATAVVAEHRSNSRATETLRLSLILSRRVGTERVLIACGHGYTARPMRRGEVLESVVSSHPRQRESALPHRLNWQHASVKAARWTDRVAAGSSLLPAWRCSPALTLLSAATTVAVVWPAERTRREGSPWLPFRHVGSNPTEGLLKQDRRRAQSRRADRVLRPRSRLHCRSAVIGFLAVLVDVTVGALSALPYTRRGGRTGLPGVDPALRGVRRSWRRRHSTLTGSPPATCAAHHEVSVNAR